MTIDIDDQLILNHLYAQAVDLLPGETYTYPFPIPLKLWRTAFAAFKRKSEAGYYDTKERHCNVAVHQTKADEDGMFYVVVVKKVKE